MLSLHLRWPAKSWSFMLPLSPYPLGTEGVPQSSTGWRHGWGRELPFHSLLARSWWQQPSFPTSWHWQAERAAGPPSSSQQIWQYLNPSPPWCYCRPLVRWASTPTWHHKADKVVQAESRKHLISPPPAHVSGAHCGPEPPCPSCSNKVLGINPLLILYASERQDLNFTPPSRQQGSVIINAPFLKEEQRRGWISSPPWNGQGESALLCCWMALFASGGTSVKGQTDKTRKRLDKAQPHSI